MTQIVPPPPPRSASPLQGSVMSQVWSGWFRKLWQSVGATFTASAPGIVPASGGGTTTFLRADGTFAAPVTVGLTVVVATAKLTTGGTNGSMTFTNGRLTAQVAAT